MVRTLRLFIAINLSTAMTTSIQESIVQLNKNVPTVKWIKTNNLHFTLAFLGSVSQNRVPQLLSSMKLACDGQEKFTISLGALDFFPNQVHPSIVWIKVETGYQAMKQLAMRLQTCLQQEQIKFDAKPFEPHLTIGRIKASQPSQLVSSLQRNWKKPSQSMSVNKISLVSSQLDQSGAHYTILGEIKLSGDSII